MFRKIIIIAAMAILSIGAQAGIASADLVNGGFENGDFTGWTLSNIDLNNDFVAVLSNSGNPSFPPNPGNYEAYLGKSGSAGTISQAFATTAGHAYTVSFWLASDDINKANTNVFQALWNGQTQNLNPVLNPNIASPYTQYLFTATAANASSTIAFNFQNDVSIYHLDNVSATPTPIPAAAWLLGSGLMGLVGIRRKPKA
jgi:hypothetical protein